jgi:hypothetical protein
MFDEIPVCFEDKADTTNYEDMAAPTLEWPREATPFLERLWFAMAVRRLR